MLLFYLIPRLIGIDVLEDRFAPIIHLDPENPSLYGRWYAMQRAMPAILKLDRLMLGYGVGTIEKSGPLGSEFISLSGLDQVWGATLSIYHVFILESGILALFLYLAILTLASLSLIKILRRSGGDYEIKSMAYGLLFSITSYSLAMWGGQCKDTLFFYFLLLGIISKVIVFSRKRLRKVSLYF
jgi:hypothetical protein